MIHPDTELRFVNDDIGYGVFATAPIPKGTIVYAKDKLEIELTPKQFNKLDKIHQNIADKYSYIDEKGNRVISWDNAKYVNHRCDCNSMSTGYGFEVAIKDINANEEITDEYGLFNIPFPIEVNCGCENCRKMLLPTDADTYTAEWDEKVENALTNILEIEQPLWNVISYSSARDLTGYIYGKKPYKSVDALRYRPVIKMSERSVR